MGKQELKLEYLFNKWLKTEGKKFVTIFRDIDTKEFSRSQMLDFIIYYFDKNKNISEASYSEESIASNKEKEIVNYAIKLLIIYILIHYVAIRISLPSVVEGIYLFTAIVVAMLRVLDFKVNALKNDAIAKYIEESDEY